MKETIKIISGKKGYHLKINGLYICQGFSADIKAIITNIGIPSAATEWVSIQAIKDFWHKYMSIIIDATKYPYQSISGNLVRFDLHYNTVNDIRTNEDLRKLLQNTAKGLYMAGTPSTAFCRALDWECYCFNKSRIESNDDFYNLHNNNNQPVKYILAYLGYEYTVFGIKEICNLPF